MTLLGLLVLILIAEHVGFLAKCSQATRLVAWSSPC